MTQENIAIAYLEMSKHDSCSDSRAALQNALAAVHAALTIFDPKHMSYHHGTTTRLSDDYLARLDMLPSPPLST